MSSPNSLSLDDSWLSWHIQWTRLFKAKEDEGKKKSRREYGKQNNGSVPIGQLTNNNDDDDESRKIKLGIII